MRRALAGALMTFTATKAVPPPEPLPSLALITRARVEVLRESVIVSTDVTFSRGDWQSGGLDLYVAFGAPGVPRAFEARLLSLGSDEAQASLADRGEALPTERAVRKPDRVLALLGSPHMAGEVVHAPEPALRRAFAASGRVTLRVRSLLLSPSPDASGAREVVIRLGTQPSPPLALSAVEVDAKDPTVRVAAAEARLCGPAADPYPIAIAGQLRAGYPTPTSPLAIVRHANDDLCVRFNARR